MPEPSGVGTIGAAWIHTCALVCGGIKCWGENNWGQLRNVATSDSSTPVDVYTLTSGAKAVAAGGGASYGDSIEAFSCALLTSNGSAKCWGSNDHGELGFGSKTSVLTPTAVLDLSGAASITGGGFHVCARLTTGAAECWGHNYYGEIGDGAVFSHTTPYFTYFNATNWTYLPAVTKY